MSYTVCLHSADVHGHSVTHGRSDQTCVYNLICSNTFPESGPAVLWVYLCSELICLQELISSAMILSTADPYASVKVAGALLQAAKYALQIKCMDPTQGNYSIQTGITSYYKAYNTNKSNRKVAFTGFFILTSDFSSQFFPKFHLTNHMNRTWLGL